MNLQEFMLFLTCYVLNVAGDDQPRTIYHDRIDGLLMPTIEPARKSNE